MESSTGEYQGYITDFDDLKNRHAEYLTLGDRPYPDRQDHPRDLATQQQIVRQLFHAMQNMEGILDGPKRQAATWIESRQWTDLEVEMTSWRLLDAVIKAQAGKNQIPRCQQRKPLSYAKFPSFQHRLDKVLEVLHISKTTVASTFQTETFVHRLAWNPHAELKGKITNQGLNDSRAHQKGPASEGGSENTDPTSPADNPGQSRRQSVASLGSSKASKKRRHDSGYESSIYIPTPTTTNEDDEGQNPAQATPGPSAPKRLRTGKRTTSVHPNLAAGTGSLGAASMFGESRTATYNASSSSPPIPALAPPGRVLGGPSSIPSITSRWSPSLMLPGHQHHAGFHGNNGVGVCYPPFLYGNPGQYMMNSVPNGVGNAFNHHGQCAFTSTPNNIPNGFFSNAGQQTIINSPSNGIPNAYSNNPRQQPPLIDFSRPVIPNPSLSWTEYFEMSSPPPPNLPLSDHPNLQPSSPAAAADSEYHVNINGEPRRLDTPTTDPIQVGGLTFPVPPPPPPPPIQQPTDPSSNGQDGILENDSFENHMGGDDIRQEDEEQSVLDADSSPCLAGWPSENESGNSNDNDDDGGLIVGLGLGNMARTLISFSEV
ncbi:hypothetical protein F4778DRAFT_427852 [Xylariomycetidae sp. FL2044]|nr:hypothetical protein F4778DRAFT_427852 [Xylariomycetidae sp. FL2044]